MKIKAIHFINKCPHVEVNGFIVSFLQMYKRTIPLAKMIHLWCPLLHYKGTLQQNHSLSSTYQSSVVQCMTSRTKWTGLNGYKKNSKLMLLCMPSQNVYLPSTYQSTRGTSSFSKLMDLALEQCHLKGPDRWSLIHGQHLPGIQKRK